MAGAKEKAYGPGLPPDLSTGVVESDCSDNASGSTGSLPSYGPCLPPELAGREASESTRTFGPALPPDVCTLVSGQEEEEEGGEGSRASRSSIAEEKEEETTLIGPSLPDPSQQVRALPKCSRVCLRTRFVVIWWTVHISLQCSMCIVPLQMCALKQIKESFESRSKAMQDRISSKVLTSPTSPGHSPP